MIQGIFNSSTIPVLEQLVQFTQARHEVLAGNVANLETPGYVARDLSVADFQARLKDAIETRQQPLGSTAATAAGTCGSRPASRRTRLPTWRRTRGASCFTTRATTPRNSR